MKKVLFAEWIEHMGCYRIYEEYSPEWTIAYDEDLKNAKDYADHNGYKLVVIEQGKFIFQRI